MSQVLLSQIFLSARLGLEQCLVRYRKDRLEIFSLAELGSSVRAE